MKSVCVFCGSNFGSLEVYRLAARDLGRAIARRGLGLVYGGSSVGLMATVADAALAQGGRVVGVIPQALRDKEIAHKGLTEQHVVGSMHERKALMAELSDAFVSLPGGLGTLDELFEMLTWSQLGFHAKPSGLLDVADYYRDLVRFLDRAVDHGFVPAHHRGLLLRSDTPDGLLDAFEAYAPPPPKGKWLDRPDLA